MFTYFSNKVTVHYLNVDPQQNIKSISCKALSWMQGRLATKRKQEPRGLCAGYPVRAQKFFKTSTFT